MQVVSCLKGLANSVVFCSHTFARLETGVTLLGWDSHDSGPSVPQSSVASDGEVVHEFCDFCFGVVRIHSRLMRFTELKTSMFFRICACISIKDLKVLKIALSSVLLFGEEGTTYLHYDWFRISQSCMFLYKTLN